MTEGRIGGIDRQGIAQGLAGNWGNHLKSQGVGFTFPKQLCDQIGIMTMQLP
jgi:hypothetical protein